MMRARIITSCLIFWGAAASADMLEFVDPARERYGVWQLASSISAYRADVYVDRNRTAQRLPDSLKITEASIQASRLFGRHFRVGVQLPYRSSSLGFQRMHALAGETLFAEAFTRRLGLDTLLRAGYFHVSEPKNSAFVIPDSGYIFLLAALATGDGMLPGSARAVMTVGAGYAAADGVVPSFGSSGVSFALSPVAFVTGYVRVRPSVLAATSMGTSGRFEGIHFANRTSRGAFSGVRVDVESAQSSANALTIEATRDVAVSNAPSGYRLSISVTKTFKRKSGAP